MQACIGNLVEPAHHVALKNGITSVAAQGLRQQVALCTMLKTELCKAALRVYTYHALIQAFPVQILGSRDSQGGFTPLLSASELTPGKRTNVKGALLSGQD